MSDGGLGLGPGWASARGGRQGEDGVGEKTHSRGGGAGDTGRASGEQGPRHDTRRGFARRVGRHARDVKEWDHAGPVFGDGLLRGHRKGQAVSEKGGGARTKLPGRWPVTAAAGRVDEPFVPAGHRGTTLGGGDKIDPRGLREWRKPRREMLMEDSQACLALLRFVDVVYLTNSRHRRQDPPPAKKFTCHFTVTFTCLRWSGTKPAVSLGHACTHRLIFSS